MSRITRIIYSMAIVWALSGSVAGLNEAMAGQPDWLLVNSDPSHSDFYYDKSAVTASPQALLTVRAKVVYSAEGKADTLKVLKAKKYENLAYTEYRYEIMCGEERKSRLQQVSHYDAKGVRIAEFDLVGKTEWEEIPISARLDMVADNECKEESPPKQ
jgi:hypothetical protein